MLIRDARGDGAPALQRRRGGQAVGHRDDRGGHPRRVPRLRENLFTNLNSMRRHAFSQLFNGKEFK